MILRSDLSEAKDILPTGAVESLVQHFERCILSPDEKPGVASLVSLVLDQQSEVACVASLAHHGLLRSVNYLMLMLSKVDLSSVPADHLASLASCVTGVVDVWNVRGYGLSTILDNVKCESLTISSQSLNTEETQALVRAMETGVEEVSLCYYHGNVDIETLIKYSGRGKCRLVRCNETRYHDALRKWKQMQEKSERRKWTTIEVLN